VSARDGDAVAPQPQPVTLVAGTRRLDARVHLPSGPARGAIVLGHPHPLHGGNMDHPVVVAACERAVAAGLLALRWDVGGVRGSEGDRADPESHRDDLRAAAREARRRVPHGPLLGGGFSYGGRLFAAVVDPEISDRPPFTGGLLLAPATHVPSSARDFGNLLLGRPLVDAGLDPRAVARLSRLPVPTRVIVGEHDVVAPPAELRKVLPPTAVLEVLPALNHFFSRAQGAGTTARDLLLPALDRALAALS
jgi:alpha/beta superfamily hydrolase